MFGWFTDRAAATTVYHWEELIPPGATQVDLHKRRLGPAGGTAVAEALRNNTTLTLLDLSTNHLGEEGGQAIAEALRHNTTLTALDLNANRLGEAGGKAMADALRHNTTLTLLNIGFFNSIPKLLLEEIKELVRTAPERRQRAEEEERRRKQEEVEREEQERIIEQRQREEQEKLRQQKEQQQQWQGERVGRTLAALRAVRLSRHSSFSDYTHAQQLLQQALDYVSTLDRTPGKAMAAALAAKEELEAVQKTIREGTAWPDEEILTRRDQARRKLVEAVRRAAAEWREQEAAAVQQRCMHWSQQLMEVLLKVGKDRTIRKVEDLKEKEKEKEKETEEAADELQSGTEALKKIREWQEIHAEQQQIMEAETESQAQKVSNAFHRVASAFSDTNESPTEEELLLKDHMASLMNAIHKEQDFLKGGVGDGPPLRALSQGIRGVVDYLQKMCKEERDKDVTLMALMKEKMKVKRVMANPPNYQLLKDLQRANKKSLVKVRVAKAEVEGADDDEEREAAQVMLAKAKTQLRQQALLLEREALQLVELSNSCCPESRFLLKELGLEAVDLMAVDCPYRRLDHYDHIQVLSSAGHHCVMKAQYQGQACVLKEFDLSSTDHQHFMRELKRLRSLQHEHIAKVEAAFVQNEDGRIKGYIHMPFYSGGNLCEWLTNGRGKDRSDAEKQRVGRGVLLALQHVHSQGIVHMDVKPQNIFVEEEGKGMGNDEEENEGNGEQHGRQRAILGDFDISSHAATGTLTMVAGGSGGGGGGRSGSEGGGTWAYMAPEVCCGEVGPAADVFSCGLLLFDLHFAVPSLQAQAQAQEPRGERRREVRPARPTLMEMVKGQEITIPPHPNPHLRDLLHQVLQLDARKRPTASQCLSHPFLWTHLVEHRVAERDRRRCVVCMDEKWLDEGLQCLPPPSSSPQPHGQRPDKGETERHFVCGGCLNGWAVSLLDMPAAVLAKRARHVPCLVNGCTAQPFPMEQLMAHVEDEGRKVLLEVRSKATEFMSEQAFQQRLEHEREQWEKQSTVQRHGRRMVEDILTLQCPRCHQAFVDFDGCFALTCSRCNAAFCAWCLQDCGKNAHRHVRGCAHNLAGGNVFGSFEQFEEGQRRRRERKVREYLNGLEREEREQVAAGLQQALQDLNIHL